MKKRIVIIAFFISSWAFPQIQFSSLSEVLKFADEHTINVKSAVLQNEIQKTQEKESKSYMLPTVNANVGFNNNITIQPTLVPLQLFNEEAPDGSFKEMTFGKQYLYSTGVQANWDILNFQKKFASQTSKLQTEAGKINIERTKFNTYNQLASTYYSILLSEESLKIYIKNKKVSAQLLDIAQNQFSKGIISEMELNHAKIQDLENEKSIQYATNNMEQLYKQFQSQLNTDEAISINDEIKDTSISGLNFRNTHPEILFEELETKIYESNLKQVKALRLPSLTLIYQYNYNWTTDNFMKFSEANNLPQQFFGMKLNIPIFSGFSTKNKILESQQQLKLQQLQLENTKIAKGKDDEILQLQFQQVSDQLGISKSILDLQNKNDLHAGNKYSAGIISLDARLDNYKDLLSTQNKYLKSLSDFALIQYKIYIRKIQF